MLILADVLEALSGTRLEGASLVISEASIDSRQVIPAGLFVALPWADMDLHSQLVDAFNHGAHLALVQQDLSSEFATIDLRTGSLPADLVVPEPPICILVRDCQKALQTIAGFRRRKLDARVVVITGSSGKSTTKDLIAEMLCQRFHTLKSQPNLTSQISVPLTLLRLGPGHERAVVELNFNQPGETRALCELARPSIGVFTNIAWVSGETDAVSLAAPEKFELVQSLPPAPEGVAVLNIDDPLGRAMAEKTSAQVLFYGLDPRADLWADRIEGLGVEGIHFRLHYHNETIYVRVPLIGRHSVHTILRSAAVGLAEGLTWQEIINGLQSGSQSQLRLVAAHTASGAMILGDTYEATPESTMAALNLLDQMGGRKIAVLGDLLESDPYEHQVINVVGARVAEVCTLLVTIGEGGKAVAEAALQAGMRSWAVASFNDNSAVVDHLNATLLKGDVVLVKGSYSLHMDRIIAALEVES